MQDAIAIASVIATATVAIALPFINARTDRVRIRGQLQNERFDELRSVLDLAALALSRADGALGSAELAIEKSQAANAGTTDETAAQMALNDAEQSVYEASEQQVRTSIRLGPEAELTITYIDAIKALEEQLEVLRNAFHGGPLSDDPQGWKEVVVPLHEARNGFERARHSASVLSAQLIGPFSS